MLPLPLVGIINHPSPMPGACVRRRGQSPGVESINNYTAKRLKTLFIATNRVFLTNQF